MKILMLCITTIVHCLCPVLAGQTYTKSLDIIGPAFYNEFSFDNSTDPTHGRVYVFIISSFVLTKVCPQ